jgi:hypothetical protein
VRSVRIGGEWDVEKSGSVVDSCGTRQLRLAFSCAKAKGRRSTGLLRSNLPARLLEVVFGEEIKHQPVELLRFFHAGHMGDIMEDDLASVGRTGGEHVSGSLGATLI